MDAIAGRASALLDDLRLHVGTPTGPNNTQALDLTRGTFTARLEALGAVTHDYAPDSRPEWILGTQASGEPPRTAVCARLVEGMPRVLIAGHLDTVHDPEGDFRELSIAPGGSTATGPG